MDNLWSRGGLSPEYFDRPSLLLNTGMRVPLRDGYTVMAEEVLDRNQINAALDESSCERVP